LRNPEPHTIEFELAFERTFPAQKTTTLSLFPLKAGFFKNIVLNMNDVICA
jgi:hypothetical protein